MLVDAGVLESGIAAPPAGSPAWAEMAGDLRRLRKVGVMVARPPLSPTAHRAACQRRFAAPRPTQALEQLAARKHPPVLTEACLVLADASSSWEIQKKKAKPATPPAKPAPAAAPPVVQAGREVDAIAR
jgi:hypothetical protein